MDLTSFLPGFENAAMTIIAFIVALSVIVAIHEYGHYIVGRWTGIKADVFSLGFGPVLASRVDKHGTKWQIALLPLGGYVKFRGDANAASAPSAEALAEIPETERRQTMAGAPVWARALTVAAGPVFNFVLAIIIFSAVAMINGQVREPYTIGALKPMPTENRGLQAGDVLVAIDGHRLRDGLAGALGADLPDAPEVNYLVERDGQELSVEGPQPFPPLISAVVPNSAAISVGLRPGDVITQIDGAPIYRFDQFKDVVESSDGRALNLKIWRDGDMLDFVLVPRFVDEPKPEGGFERVWRVGIAGGLSFEPATENPGVIAALSAAVERVWSIITGSLSGLFHMITGAISSCNMSGPIGIAQASGAMASQGTQSFITFVAVLSTAIGFLNLLPVPVLDGGHLMFHAYEAISGRPPSERVLNVLMSIGLALLLTLMVFALGNDLFCPR